MPDAWWYFQNKVLENILDNIEAYKLETVEFIEEKYSASTLWKMPFRRLKN